MDHSLRTETLRRLRRHVAGEVTFRAFEEWFISNSWTVERVGDQATLELVYQIELDLAEHSNGHRTEGELGELLTSLLQGRPKPKSGTTARRAGLDSARRHE